MPTASTICISYASPDRPVAEKFRRTLTDFGFDTTTIDEATPTATRDVCLHACAMLLVLTSPAASQITSCETDFTYMMSLHRPVMCIRLSPSEMEDRLTESNGALAERFLAYPYAATDYPDDRAVAMFVHRLLIRHLCRLSSCFDPDACTDSVHGRIVRTAVKAWAGDPHAQYRLGIAYDRGDGLPQLDTEAAMWMSKASLSEYVEAMLYLGDMKLSGDGVEKNPAEALALFTRAAALGDPRGFYSRALCYLYGYGVMKDPEMALHYLSEVAAHGYPPAYFRLGLMYRDGVGTPHRDWRRAVAFLFAACRAEGLDAPLYGRCLEGHRGEQRYRCVSMRHMRQIRLGDRLFAAHPHWREDPRAVARVKRAFAESRAVAVGFAEDAFLPEVATAPHTEQYDPTRGYSRQTFSVAVAADALGQLLDAGSPSDGIPPAPRAAMAWYRRAMRLGHSGATYRLGALYRRGSGVPATPTQAVTLFRLCADRHNEQGRFALAVCYERGIGVARDLTAAVTHYEIAAKAGYAPAQNNLGGCYEQGLGVSRDMPTAAEWYGKATAAGHPQATCRLGICYENGLGVTLNAERAFHLYERAAERGLAYAIYRLALCYDKGIYVREQPTVAARLYERAADGGVADASYAFGLCCLQGRGVRPDERAGFLRLAEAAARGHVLGAYRVGRCYFEGRAAVQSYARAVDAFTRTVTLYEKQAGALPEGSEQTAAIREAAADAMYYLGYCTLYGVGRPAQEGEAAPSGQAAMWFRRAAALAHKDALTALGDLYTHGLISDGSPKEEAERAYESAARLGQSNAALSLSEDLRRRAVALAAEGRSEDASALHARAYGILSPCAAAGDSLALQAMAAYTYFGWGTTADRHEALRYLHSAVSSDGAAVASDGATAYLWLGDAYYAGQDGTVDLTAADKAYGYAAALNTNAPCPVRILRERWQDRMTYARRVQAEACYRLAILRAVGFEDDRRAQREEAFAYLTAAILAGHGGALDDLARMYTYEKACADEAEAALAATAGRRNKRAKAKDRSEATGATHRGTGKAAVGASVAAVGAVTDRHDHLAWMTAYYSARRPTLVPFAFDILPKPRATAPAYVTAEVTPTMRAVALNHLADCLLDGREIPEDHAAAVDCYRRAADTRQPPHEPVADGIVQAKYSLGRCLLNGEGTAKNPREGVRLLTEAARHHADAAYLLASCYQTGIGVDARNVREAVKYYRKAVALRHPEAAARLKLLEKQLG